MGSAILFTAEHMQQIEDATITSMSVDGTGHLIVTRHDGSTFDAGDVSAWLPGRLTETNNLGSGNDPDVFTDNGWYAGTGWISSLAGYSFGILEVLAYDADYIVQNFWTADATPRRLNRAMHGGVWTSWTEPDAVISASTGVRGQVILASDAESLAETETTKVLTPSNLAVKKASSVETAAGVISNKFVTPLGLITARDAGMFDNRYFTESEINTLLLEPKQGVLPSSVVVGSGTASVASSGLISFSSCSSVSLNGVFDGLNADTYLLLGRFNTTDGLVTMTLRNSNVDDAATTPWKRVANYNGFSNTNGTLTQPVTSANAATSDVVYWNPTSGGTTSDSTGLVHLYTPGTSDITTIIADILCDIVGERFFNWHEVAKRSAGAFDGVSIIAPGGTMTGWIKVIKQA